MCRHKNRKRQIAIHESMDGVLRKQPQEIQKNKKRENIVWVWSYWGLTYSTVQTGAFQNTAFSERSNMNMKLISPWRNSGDVFLFIAVRLTQSYADSLAHPVEGVRYVHRQQLGSIFSLPRPAFSHRYFIEKPERKVNSKEAEHLNNPLQLWCLRPDLKRLKPVRVLKAFKSCCVWFCWDQYVTKWSFKSWLINGHHFIQFSVYKNK